MKNLRFGLPFIPYSVKISEMKKNRIHIAVLTLLTFLFSGIGATSVLPILITTLAPAHPVFITENNHKFRLVLHHPGNHDEHEAREDKDHHHDLLDIIIDVSKNNEVSHTDHEIELPSFEEEISPTTKSFVDINQIFPLSGTHILPLSVALESGYSLPHSPSISIFHQKFFRTTILII